MGLAHAWRRQGIWATAVTLVVPAALAVAVATVLLGGGLRSLGVLGQIFTGPKVPEAQLTAGTAPAHRGTRLPAVPAAGLLAARPPAAAAGPGAAPVTRGPRGAGPLATAPPRRPVAGRPAPAAGSSPAPAQSPPPPAPPRGPIHQAGQPVAHTVGTLPGPAGPAGEGAVNAVLDIIEPGGAARLIPQR